MHRFLFRSLAIFRVMSAVLLGMHLLFPARIAHALSPSDQYLLARRASPPQAGLSLEAAAQNPDAYRGMTLEVEGRLLGIARSGLGASLMLSTEKNGAITLQMSELPTWVQPGDRLRMLVVVAGNRMAGATIGLPVMEAVAVASASDIAAAEARWQVDASSRAARERQRQEAFRGAAATLARPAFSRGARPSAARAARRGLDSRAASLSRSLSPDARAVYAPYRAAIRALGRRLSEREVDAITTSILLFSERMDVDPRLVIAMVIAESDFDPKSTSRKGAMGLGQLMPDEAKALRLSNPYDPVQNIAGAIYLLKGRLDRYSGGAAKRDLTMQHIILALASYNAGMGAVKKYGGVPPYRETQNYVKKIEKLYRWLAPDAGAS